MSTEVAEERDGDTQANKLYDKHCYNTSASALIIPRKPVPQFHQATLLPVAVDKDVTGVSGTAGDWDVIPPILQAMDSTALKHMLDIVKVVLNGLVSILTGASVNLQAYHQIVLNVSINLPAEDQKNDGHGQLDQHQDEQQDKKTDEHASILSQATQKSKVTHACGNGSCHHKSVGREDGPEWGADGGEPGVDHLKFPKCHHKCTAQPTKEVKIYHSGF